MGITQRDLQVIRYLEQGFLLNTEILSRLIYWTGNKKSSLSVTQRRLKELYNLKQVKRIRQFVGQPFIYYLGKTPTKAEHRLAMSDFLSQMTIHGFEIILDETQTEYKELEKKYSIRPDMLVTFKYKNDYYRALVEIDLTKKFTHADEYTRFLKDRREGKVPYLKDYKLALVSVCEVQPDMRCIWVKPDWSNFSNFTSTFEKL